jgi:hypothetical protein
MAISLASISRNPVIAPPRVLLYGPHKIGKTTFGASAPNAVVLPLEEGIGRLEVPSFPLLRTFTEVMEALLSLRNEPHDFATAVIDSADWLEPIVWQQTCARYQKKDIEDFGYGKGYVAALDDWRILIDTLGDLRMQRNMAIIVIAHANVKRYDDPTSEPYDRYQIKLQDRASALLEEWVDAILFLNQRVSIASDKVGRDQSRKRGVGTGERIIYTEERPAFKAGNRYGLPTELPCPHGAGWAVLQDAMMAGFNQAKPAATAATSTTETTHHG